MRVKYAGCFKQPFTGSNWIYSLLIGAGLALIAALAAPYGLLGAIVQVAATAFGVGYTLRVSANAVASEGSVADLPDWTEAPLQMLQRGLLGSIMDGLYSIGFIGLAVLALSVLKTASTAGAASPVTAALIIAELLVLLVVSVLFVPFLALISTHYAVTGRISAFIQFGQAFSRMKNRPLTTILAVLATVGIGMVSALFGLIPFIGVFAVALAQFAAQLMFANLWAQVYRS